MKARRAVRAGLRANKAKRAEQNDQPPPRKKVTVANITIGGAAVAGAWGVAGYVLKVPALADAGLSGTVSALGIWALVVAKIEDRKKAKEKDADD